MASNSKSGLNPEDRVRFMRDHGYVEARNGKGSHEMWVHPELMALAREHKITAPANYLSNPNQKAWEACLPDNPGPGTWHKISRLAEWCVKTTEEYKTAADRKAGLKAAIAAFREAAQEVCEWKREVKHRLRAGLDIDPRGPHSTPEMRELEKAAKLAKQQLSGMAFNRS